MTKFRALFSFSKKEIALFFSKAIQLSQIRGLKILGEQVPCVEQENLAHGKFLIIVPKKVGNACVRNRLRRQIKAIIYENGLTKIGIRIAIICYPQSKDFSFDMLKKTLPALLKNKHHA